MWLSAWVMKARLSEIKQLANNLEAGMAHRNTKRPGKPCLFIPLDAGNHLLRIGVFGVELSLKIFSAGFRLSASSRL